jgi:hypothetical protein
LRIIIKDKIALQLPKTKGQKGYLNSWKPRTLVELKDCQSKAVKDHNTNRRKEALGNISPIQFRTMLQKEKNITSYTLALKPRVPAQPKKKNTFKTEILT